MANPEEKHFLIPEASIGVKCSGKKGWTENIKVALKESLPKAICEEKNNNNNNNNNNNKKQARKA